MDSNDSKKNAALRFWPRTAAVEYEGTHINIVDTPGHADFGGEVERVLSMVDGVLLLVDAVEGPMPQTRFVTRKALALGLKPIVVINKIDRPGARPDWVINADFRPVRQAGRDRRAARFPRRSTHPGLAGYAGLTDDVREGDMRPLFETILKYVPQREDDADAPLQMQSFRWNTTPTSARSAWAASIAAASVPPQDVVVKFGPEGAPIKGRINQVLKFRGLERVLVDEAQAGDIVLINGIDEIGIGCTIMDPAMPGGLAFAAHRRADADHELHGEYVAIGGPRRQVRHQPPIARASGSRAQVQRGAARQRYRRRYRVRSVRAAASCI